MRMMTMMMASTPPHLGRRAHAQSSTWQSAAAAAASRDPRPLQLHARRVTSPPRRAAGTAAADRNEFHQQPETELEEERRQEVSAGRRSERVPTLSRLAGCARLNLCLCGRVT